MSMTGSPLNLKTKRTKEVMPCSMLVETKERPARNLIKTSNTSTATRMGTRKLTVGQKEVGRKDRDLNPSQSKSKREEPKKKTANASDEGEGVWMAVVSNSDNENMADNEFDDFTISDDDLFFEDNNGNTKAILIKDMKNLKISETSKPITYSYCRTMSTTFARTQ